MEKLVHDEFGNSVQVVSIRDPGRTDNFEIIVNGTLVHSRKKWGDGFVKTDDQKNNLIKVISQCGEVDQSEVPKGRKSVST